MTVVSYTNFRILADWWLKVQLLMYRVQCSSAANMLTQPHILQYFLSIRKSMINLQDDLVFRARMMSADLRSTSRTVA